MRTVPAAITTARESATSQLATIWRLERTDGTVLRFTDHDTDLAVDGETFVSAASFDPSALKAVADMSVSDLEVVGAFDSAAITQEDLFGGRYLGASFWVAEVLWSNPGAGKDVKKQGWIGRVREVGGKFIAELHGLESRLQHPILRVHTPGCNAVLGDDRCTVDLAGFTQSGVVTAVTNNGVFTVSGVSNTGAEPSWFEFGRLTFTSGANDGLSMEMRGMSNDGTVTTWTEMPFDVAVGDTLDMVAGCNGSLGACRFKFNNVLNYRGKPHVPISDDVVKGPVRGGIPDSSGGTSTGSSSSGVVEPVDQGNNTGTTEPSSGGAGAGTDSGGTPGVPGTGEQSATFTISGVNHVHMDRGIVWDGDDNAAAIAGGSRLLHQYFVLSSFTGTDTISSTYLSEVAATLAAHRTYKTRAIVRFTYNFSDTAGDVSLTRFRAHVDQLAPILNTYKDVIAYFEAGFVGQYGEWWTGGASTLYASRTQVKDYLITKFPADRFICFRLLDDLIGWYSTAPTSMATALSRRMGAHNDLWLSNTQEGGTFKSTAQFDYLAALTAYAPQTGEIDVFPSIESAFLANRVNWNTRGLHDHWHSFRIANDRAYFYDWLATQPNPLTNAANGGQAYFKNALGFWLEYVAFYCNLSVARGGGLTYTLNVRNRGWSRSFLKKRLRIILVPALTADVNIDTPISTVDPRDWFGQQGSGQWHTATATVTVPSGAAAGAYIVHVALVDDDFPSDVAYNIRPGNATSGAQQWDATRGSWITGLTLTVT